MVCTTMGRNCTGFLPGTDHASAQIRQSPPSNRLWAQQSFFEASFCQAHVSTESNALGHRESPPLATGCHPWRRWLSDPYWGRSWHFSSPQQCHFELDGPFGRSECGQPSSLFRCLRRSGCSGSLLRSLFSFLEWESPERTPACLVFGQRMLYSCVRSSSSERQPAWVRARTLLLRK